MISITRFFSLLLALLLPQSNFGDCNTWLDKQQGNITWVSIVNRFDIKIISSATGITSNPESVQLKVTEINEYSSGCPQAPFLFFSISNP